MGSIDLNYSLVSIKSLS